MIVDTLKNAALYRSLYPGFDQAFDYLATNNLLQQATGKYNINKVGMFAGINEYYTKPKDLCEHEAHKKYIDIQYLITGEEVFGYAPLQDQPKLKKYDANSDVVIFLAGLSYIKLQAGMFIIFFPTDIHQPEVYDFAPVKVKKIVIKIPVST